MDQMTKYCAPNAKFGFKFIAAFLLIAAFIVIVLTVGLDTYTDEEGGPVFMLVIIPVFLLLAVIYGIDQRKVYKAELEHLVQRGVLELAKSDFAVSVPQFDGELRVGKRFLFGHDTGKIVPYDEIGKIYRSEYITRYLSGAPDKIHCMIIAQRINSSKIDIISNCYRHYDAEWANFVQFMNLKAPQVNAVFEPEVSVMEVADIYDDD